ncbi:MAG: DUF1501 domain-containing protein [Planctomycetia bacterium]|nr:DUF1501 domain-containing protein [Planctomycetia bacterium]
MSASTDHVPPPSTSLPRRELLRRAGGGFGMLGLAGLLHDEAAAGPALPDAPLAPRPGHFPARAKSVIWLFINGGPSHVDTFDHKPALAAHDGEPLPEFDKNTGFFAGAVGGLMPSPFEFRRHGASGAWVSSLFPHLARHVDRMAFIKSCWTDSNNHAPALLKINTGIARMGYPCTGSWVTYGLGSENRDLPGFVVMYDTKGRGLPKGYATNWSAGFLPGVFQGTGIDTAGAPIPNLARDQALSAAQQRAQFDLAARLNGRHHAAAGDDAALQARIESFELAYRMQMAAPEALDLASETRETHDLYGLDDPTCGHFAKQCLIARRLVERGVRFIQIYSGGEENQRSWDGHADILGNHSGFAAETDRPIAALLEDLARRGLLDETLVIWGGEFGRLPIAQKGAKPGRDHNPHAFTVWMAGGGTRPGVTHGATDEFGFKAVTDRVSVNDLHATILHLLGMDHRRLTYRFNGRDFRLTDVAGTVVAPVVA